MHPETLVALSGLHKTYPGAAKPAIDGIDLSIRKGSIFGLIGPNGAGKTTLMSILCGLLKADTGKLEYQWAQHETSSRIGWVPQELAIYPALTATENMRFFGSMHGLAGTLLQQRIEDCLAIAGLQSQRQQLCDTFSGGMKRRLNLAIGMLHQPDLLVLDEPTVGVDAQSRNLIHDTLRQLHADGTTILYTTHYMEEAQELCEELAIIDHGHIIAQGQLAQLLKQYDDSSLVIETGQIPPATILAELRAMSGVIKLSAENKRIVINGKPSEDLIIGALNILRRGDIRVFAAHFGSVALEDIFLQLTGTRLRD